jgi:hypothetical protein
LILMPSLFKPLHISSVAFLYADVLSIVFKNTPKGYCCDPSEIQLLASHYLGCTD